MMFVWQCVISWPWVGIGVGVELSCDWIQRGAAEQLHGLRSERVLQEAAVGTWRLPLPRAPVLYVRFCACCPAATVAHMVLR